MARQISTQAQAAKIIRKHLKDHGVAAKVRAGSASMMTAVRVSLVDPMPATVKLVEDYVSQFQYGHFDGMTDSYEYSNKIANLPQVTFVTVSTDYSEDIKSEAKMHVVNNNVENDGFGMDSLFYRVLRGSVECNFWTTRKPRVLAAA